jgi:ribosome-associated protein
MFHGTERRPSLSRELAIVAADAAAAKTLEDTVVLDVAAHIAITDYFVVTSGRNDRQVRAILDQVGAAVRAAGGPRPRQVEGLTDLRWVLMDYGSFVVHVFHAEAREFYGLERLWADAPRVEHEAALAGPGGR